MKILNRYINHISGIVFSSILVVVLLYQLDFDYKKIQHSLAVIPLYILIISFVFNMMTIVFRSFIYKILLGRKIKLVELLGIITEYQFYSNFIPYRIGELSVVVLIKKKIDNSFTENLVFLTVARIFDTVSFILLVSWSVIVIGSGLPGFQLKIEIQIVLLFSIALLLLICIIKARIIINAIIKVINCYKLNNWEITQKITTQAEAFSKHFTVLENKPYKLVLILFISIILALLVYGNSYLFLHALGINLSFSQVIIAMSVTILTIVLPIQGFANLGTFESTFLIGLLLFGVSQTKAIPAVFTLHIYSYLIILILFILSRIFFIFRRGNKG